MWGRSPAKKNRQGRETRTRKKRLDPRVEHLPRRASPNTRTWRPAKQAHVRPQRGNGSWAGGRAIKSWKGNRTGRRQKERVGQNGWYSKQVQVHHRKTEKPRFHKEEEGHGYTWMYILVRTPLSGRYPGENVKTTPTGTASSQEKKVSLNGGVANTT